MTETNFTPIQIIKEEKRYIYKKNPYLLFTSFVIFHF